MQAHPGRAFCGAEFSALNHHCSTYCNCVDRVRHQTSYPKLKKKNEKENSYLLIQEGRFLVLPMQLEPKGNK